MTYMVMETHPGYAVVLDENGRFLKVANMRYQVGQQVTDVVEAALPPALPQQRNTRRFVTSLVSAAACLVLILTSLFFTVPYASVYMTINPEVRIDVSRGDVVVGLTGVNEDGKALIEGYDFRMKNLNLVMDDLVDRAIGMEYLHTDGTITLTLDADNKWIVNHETALGDHLKEHLSDAMHVDVAVKHHHDEHDPDDDLDDLDDDDDLFEDPDDDHFLDPDDDDDDDHFEDPDDDDIDDPDDDDINEPDDDDKHEDDNDDHGHHSEDNDDDIDVPDDDADDPDDDIDDPDDDDDDQDDDNDDRDDDDDRDNDEEDEKDEDD